jgi:hypothetical protein
LFLPGPTSYDVFSHKKLRTERKRSVEQREN